MKLSTGSLAPGQAAQIKALVAAAAQADGVRPLSEHALLHVERGSTEPSADIVCSDAGQVVGYAHLDLAADETSGELVVHPAKRRRGVGGKLAAALLDAGAGHEVRVWAHGDLPAAAALARSAGFTRFRALWQMWRSPGPVPAPKLPDGVAIRPFVVGQDEQAWLAVNGRAFASHPEQGGWRLEDVRLRENEPWFDPEGFLLAERDGGLVGFHWTKTHPDGAGEIYVLGVDPAEQGTGLGRALSLAGLRYLSRRGIERVMLYVDESNAAAVKMYESLGFIRQKVDVMYRRSG